MLFLTVIATVLTLSQSYNFTTIEQKWNHFEEFMIRFKKIYESSEELEHRFSIFRNNLEYIQQVNQEGRSYTLGINQFTDMTQEEYSLFNYLGERPKSTFQCEAFKSISSDIPESWDWREHNAVTNVKDQGQCGSCWSFSSSGAMEGAWAIETGTLLNISEQQLVDCSRSYGNMGCHGGLMDNAFKYVIDNGLCSEEEYPYQAEQGQCSSAQCNRVVQIDNYADVEPNNEKVLMRAVAHQPISVAIQANLTSFRFYKRGVYQDPDCTDKLDHGVLIVGYGTDILQDLDYWIVKNSWTSNWGDEGYVKILRNYEKYGGDSSGMCGIAVQPSYPIIN